MACLNVIVPLDADAGVSGHQAVLQQSERVFQQGQQIDSGELILLAPGVSQKVCDDAVQPFRFPGHNLQQLAVFVAEIGNPGKHADGAGNRSQRIADFMRDRRRQPSHGRQPVLDAQVPLQAPDFGQVIEGINVAQSSSVRGRRRTVAMTRRVLQKPFDATKRTSPWARSESAMGNGIKKELLHRLSQKFAFRALEQLLCGSGSPA